MISGRRHVAGLQRAGVRRQRRRRRGGVARQVDVDREIREGRDGQGDRVADDHRARRNVHRRAGAERHGAIGRFDDRGVLLAEGDVRGADRQRRRAEGVAQDDADAIAAEAGVDDLAQRLVVEVERRAAAPSTAATLASTSAPRSTGPARCVRRLTRCGGCRRRRRRWRGRSDCRGRCCRYGRRCRLRRRRLTETLRRHRRAKAGAWRRALAGLGTRDHGRGPGPDPAVAVLCQRGGPARNSGQPPPGRRGARHQPADILHGVCSFAGTRF